jgi:hypothetical protein
MPVSDVLARTYPEQTQAPIAFEARRAVELRRSAGAAAQ